jgi:hypothetical protein
MGSLEWCDFMYYFCTFFDQHYMDKGLALYHSLNTHCLPFQLWILCMDEITYRILTDMQLPQVHLISLTDFERDDFQLIKAKQNRSLIEYYFTCTPSLPLYVLNQSPEVDIITYLDADLFFFSSIEPVYQELGNGSILIIGHRFPPALKHFEDKGIYNVGMLSFRRNDNGLACLNWWRDRCLEWCYDEVDNGRYGDQKYLDDWPERFARVVVLQHKGAGLAPWNLANYAYSRENMELTIDGQPIIMYHFINVKWINRWICDTNVSAYKTRLPDMVKQGLYIPYLMELNYVNNNLDKYLGSNFGKKQSIRGSIEARISLKTLKIIILNLLQYVMYPVTFFRKYINNDFILKKPA